MADNDDLDFSSLFERAAAGKPVEEAAPAEPTPTEPATPAEPTPAEPTPAELVPSEPTPATPAEPVVPAPAEPVDVSALIQQTADAMAKAMKPEAPAEPVVPQTFIPAEVKQEMDNLRATLEKDWPDHLPIVDVMDKALAAQAQAMMAEFAKIIDPLKAQLAPVQQTLQEQAAATYEATILKAHPDAFDIAPAIEQWIGGKPAALQSAYKAIFEGTAGTVSDVVALVSEYKKETGMTKPAAPVVPAKPDPETQKKIEESAPVAATRVSGTGVIDPNDFEGAFAAAVKAKSAA